MVTFKGNRTHPMCDGVDVIRDGKVLGFICVSGSFHKNVDVEFTEDECNAIRDKCKKVYETPSEWGMLGVGESPTEPFENFLARNPDWISL
ncbi:MAG: hypothetical protein HY505_02165 [Candidatus Yanofskybacteria bacterium]|nr:hypothetical protein [Candidatus Yanofskybacteria bacterium]